LRKQLPEYARAVLHRALPLVACAAAAAAAGCGGSGDPAVAHVAGRAIPKSEPEDTVTHFRAEAKREGRDLPADGTARFEVVRAQLLKLLVARAELDAAAAEQGIHVTQAEAEQRLSSSSAEPREGTDAFVVSTARAQIVEERLFAKATRGVTVPAAAAHAYYRTTARPTGTRASAR
jgi:SurA-like N-terminal domain